MSNTSVFYCWQAWRISLWEVWNDIVMLASETFGGSPTSPTSSTTSPFFLKL